MGSNFYYFTNFLREKKTFFNFQLNYDFLDINVSLNDYKRFGKGKKKHITARGKSLLKSWGTTFPPDWKPPSIYFKITWALAILLEHMHKKFEINLTKIKGSCQSGRKMVTHNSKSDLPQVKYLGIFICTVSGLGRGLHTETHLKHFLGISN